MQRLDTLYVITCIYIIILNIHTYIYTFICSLQYNCIHFVYIYYIIYTATRLFWRGTIYLDVACVYGKLHVCVSYRRDWINTIES